MWNTERRADLGLANQELHVIFLQILDTHVENTNLVFFRKSGIEIEVFVPLHKDTTENYRI